MLLVSSFLTDSEIGLVVVVGLVKKVQLSLTGKQHIDGKDSVCVLFYLGAKGLSPFAKISHPFISIHLISSFLLLVGYHHVYLLVAIMEIGSTC